MLRNKKDAVTFFLGLLTVFGLFLIVLEAKTAYENFDYNFALRGFPASFSRIEAGSLFWNVGDVKVKGDRVKKVFSLRNNSEEKISLSKIFTSCGCLEANIFVGGEKMGTFSLGDYLYPRGTNIVVSPGAGFSAETVFDPSRLNSYGVGVVEPFVLIKSDKGDNVSLRVRAVVEP